MLKRLYPIFITILCIGLASALIWSRASQQVIVINDSAYQRVLDRRLSEIHIHDTPLDQAIEKIGKLAGVQIIVRWPVAEADGFSRTQRVNLDATDLALQTALYVAMHGEQTRENTIGVIESAGTVLIGAELPPVTRTYDLSDIFADQLALEQQWQPPAPSGGGSLSFGPGPISYNNQSWLDQHQDFDLFIRWLQNDVDPESWRDNGGQVGSVQVWRGRMMVTQTEPNHEEIVRFLRTFRQRGVLVPPAPGNQSEEDDSPVFAEYRKLRARRVGKIHFDQTPMNDAVAKLAVDCGAPIFMTGQADQWRDVPVTLEIGPATLGEAIDALLVTATKPGKNPVGPFSAGVRNGFLHIGLAEEFPPPAYLRIYDIRDLALARADANKVQAEGKFISGQMYAINLQAATQEIADMIAAREKDLGGVEATAAFSVSSWAGRLVVTMPAEGHRAVRRVIAELRAAAATPPPTTRPANPPAGAR